MRNLIFISVFLFCGCSAHVHGFMASYQETTSDALTKKYDIATDEFKAGKMTTAQYLNEMADIANGKE